MASLKDIRRRISSVKSTQQITKAMKMVSAAKLRRAQEMITNARPFADKIDELSSRLMTDISAEAEGIEGSDLQKYLLNLHPLLRKANSKKEKIALLIVSSDKGLCGAYNTNAYKYAWSRYTQLCQENDDKPTLYFVGKKSFSSFRKNNADGKLYEDFWSGKFSRIKCNEITNELMSEFTSGRFDRVEIIYTEFVSALTQNLKHRTLLPLVVESNRNEKPMDDQENSLPFLYKPDRKVLLQRLLPAQVQTQAFRCLADSLASEFGSRMTSMDNATRNASDMINDLTLEANRVRQASITTELTEIVSGAEALNG